MASKKPALVVIDTQAHTTFKPAIPQKRNDPLSGIVPPQKAPVMPHQRSELEDLVRSCVSAPLSRAEMDRLCYIFRRAHGQGVAAGMKAGRNKD